LSCSGCADSTATEVELQEIFGALTGMAISSFGTGGTDGIDNVRLTAGGNHAPDVADDMYHARRGTVLSVPAPGVLGNDFDADRDPLTAALDVVPSHGSITLGSDGSFEYTPAPGFAGQDNFTYKASDAVASSVGTVTINVFSPNSPPMCSGVSASPDPLTASPHGEFTTVTLSGATDPDGDPLEYRIDSVTQDEAVSGSGPGKDTFPDARHTDAGNESNQGEVRAERSQKGNGRVYQIAFSVFDGKGAGCIGEATVNVPRKKGDTAVDDGGTSRWDSFTGSQVALLAT
jgi:hypothetical protein